MIKIITILLVFLTFNIETKDSKASYYSNKFHGKKTASGQVYDRKKMSCASINSIPFGTKLKVMNIQNGNEVIVVVNDRGNFQKYGRDLDLSEAAFLKLTNNKKQLGTIKIRYGKVDI